MTHFAYNWICAPCTLRSGVVYEYCCARCASCYIALARPVADFKSESLRMLELVLGRTSPFHSHARAVLES